MKQNIHIVKEINIPNHNYDKLRQKAIRRISTRIGKVSKPMISDDLGAEFMVIRRKKYWKERVLEISTWIMSGSLLTILMKGWW
jgi:hypothetical protein